MSRVAHVEFDIGLPADSTVEVRAEEGSLVVTLESPNSRKALLELSDALRGLVVNVESQATFLGSLDRERSQ